MAGKDGGEEIIKQGFMIKRSQNKKRFSPINYKQRWFVLTCRHLIYYDSEGEICTVCQGYDTTVLRVCIPQGPWRGGAR